MVRPCRFTNQSAVSHGRAGGELAIDPLRDPPAGPIAAASRQRPHESPSRIVGIETEKTRSRPLAFDRRQLLFVEFTQSEDQSPADGDILLRIQLSQDLVRIRARGDHPVNEITAGPRVGAMLEHRPDLLLALEPQERHGGIGLALGQPVLGLFRNQRPVPDRCCQRGFG